MLHVAEADSTSNHVTTALLETMAVEVSAPLSLQKKFDSKIAFKSRAGHFSLVGFFL